MLEEQKEQTLHRIRFYEKKEPEEPWEYKIIFKLHHLSSGEKVLDIGCNTGEFCYLLWKKYDACPTGIDTTPEAIAIAKKKYPKLKFNVKSAVDITEKNYYDSIYMLHVVEHLQDPRNAFARIRTALKDRGRLIITCPNKWAYPDRILARLRGYRLFSDPTHVWYFNPLSLTRLLNESGYAIEKIITKPLPLGPQNKVLFIPAWYVGAHIFVVARKI